MLPRLFIIILLLVCMAWSGCADDRRDNPQWKVGEDIGSSHHDGGETGADIGDSDSGDLPQGLVPEALVGPSWHGVFRLTDDPAITGIFVDLTFHLDGSVEVRHSTAGTGRWEIEEDLVRVYDLDFESPEFVLNTVLDRNDQLTALKLLVSGFPGVATYNQSYERAQTPEIALSELRGRWQATSRVSNDSGDFTLGMRVGEDGIIEIGFVNGANFVAYATGAGLTQTFASGDSFWSIRTRNEGDVALTGQITGQGEDRRIYLYTESGARRVAMPLKAVDLFFAE